MNGIHEVSGSIPLSSTILLLSNYNLKESQNSAIPFTELGYIPWIHYGMQHMAKYPYLQQVKSGIFYYKRRWKAEHVHLFSGKFFRKSLKTKVKDIALKEYWKFEAWYQSECDKADKALEEEKAKFKPAPLHSASLDSLLAFVNRYVAEEDEVSKARISHSLYDSSLYEVSKRDPAQLVVPTGTSDPE